MIHTVKKGEVLPEIARRYALEPAVLAGENQLLPHTRLCPGQSLVIPGNDRPDYDSLELMGFFTPPADEAVLEQTLPYLSYACCCDCSFDAKAELIFTQPTALPPASGWGCAAMLRLSNSAENSGFSSSLAHRLFSATELQERLLENTLSTLLKGNYYGLHLAFNYIFPFDRDNYSRFAENAAKLLHDNGFIFSVELAPKESAGFSSALCAGQDSAVLGACADRISLMSCRWAHSYSPPLPLAPMPQLRAALELTLQDVSSQKLLMGISGWAYDWKLPWRQGDRARQLSHADALELCAAVGSEIVYDSRAEAPGFFYTDAAQRRHRLWFEDPRSLEAKLSLVREYALAGLGVYSMDKLYRPFLSLIQSRCSIEKLL